MSEETVRAKGEMSERLKSLQTNETFLYLKSVVEKKRDAVIETLSRAILAGGEIDPVKLARAQGFWEGAMHVLNRPENAEEAFLKVLKRLEED